MKYLRDHSLNKETTKEFISECETGKNNKNIFSIIHDSRTLFEDIKKTDANNLSNIVKPFIQIVNDEIDPYSGLKLNDIWRYLRLTWSIEHQEVPGRRLAFLIRNNGYSYKPIIGIGNLVSPVLQLSIRDKWIGWNFKTLKEKLAIGDVNINELITYLEEIFEFTLNQINIIDLKKHLSKNFFTNPTIKDFSFLRNQLTLAKKER